MNLSVNTLPGVIEDSMCVCVCVCGGGRGQEIEGEIWKIVPARHTIIDTF